MHRNSDVDDSESIQKHPKIDYLTFKLRKKDGTKKVENGSAVRHTVYRKHIRKQERNMADGEIRPAPSWLKANIWKHFGFCRVDGESELDKSHA